MHYHKICHGISYGSRIGKIIWKLPESDIHLKCPSRNGPLTTTNTSGNWRHSSKHHRKCNSKTKWIQSNIHKILFGTWKNMKKWFPHILGRGNEKPDKLRHKTLPNMTPQEYETKILATKNKRHKKQNRPADWNWKRVCWNYQSRCNPETG